MPRIVSRTGSKIGVLALQGDFAEHAHMLRKIGTEPVEVRKLEQLTELDGLIIPGGESTTISKLALSAGLTEILRTFQATYPSWFTCTQANLLKSHLEATSHTPHLL